ncbi:MAG: F0F1 ATP synthase subunit epsilon [Xanthomonadaceae bacterium]|nr:F0F1 ATP synthase subunit epsilon [Rhodospirillaceae bacterium]NIA17756.1 F0F1 ATP synthase subunit epsilon [Xanthomonadaceae bacterium]
MKFEIVTPEKTVFKKDINQITIPTKDGEITVLPNHIPLISVLVPGEIIIKKDGESFSIAVSGGFVEVSIDKVVILADTAERAEEIDEKRAEEAKKRAEKIKTEKTVDSREFASLSAKIKKELARIKVARKRKRI